MATLEIEIINKLGLHARASAKFTQLAARFPCELSISRNGRKVNGKSIMGVMMLAAAKGSIITLEASGEKDQQCLDELATLIHDKFGEGE